VKTCLFLRGKLLKTILFLLLVCATLFGETSYPKIANYFLDPSIKISEIDSLAKCDLLVLDHEVSRRSPFIIDSIRKLNPDCLILAYIVSEEIELNADQWNGSLRKSMLAQIQENWWLKNSLGEFVSFWPGTRMLNIAAGQPEISSLKWNRYLAGIISDSILTDSRWDGIYIDNCWSTVSWQDSLIDLDRDGIPESAQRVDSLWKSGMNVLLDLIRTENPTKLIVGNGAYEYGTFVNGALFEDFPTWGGWFQLYESYKNLEQNSVKPSINILNATTANTGTIDYKKMRFGLANALMGEGYFSYDYGANDHSQHWWFDEYRADLGNPIEPVQIHGRTVVASNDFESSWDSWSGGDWEMKTAIIEDSIFKSHAMRAEVSGKEEWNDIVRSTVLSIGQNAVVKFSVRIRVDSVQPDAQLYSALREGDKYDSEYSFGMIPIYETLDTTLTFYSDSAIVGSGYSFVLGIQNGGTVIIDDLSVETSENLTFSRKFERGIVLLNPSPKPQTFEYPGYIRLSGTQDSIHNSGVAADIVTLNSQDGILLKPNPLQTTGLTIAKIPLTFSQNTTEISIPSRSVMQNVTLSDFRGRVVFQHSVLVGESIKIPIALFASGIYIITLASTQQTISAMIRF